MCIKKWGRERHRRREKKEKAKERSWCSLGIITHPWSCTWDQGWVCQDESVWTRSHVLDTFAHTGHAHLGTAQPSPALSYPHGQSPPVNTEAAAAAAAVISILSQHQSCERMEKVKKKKEKKRKRRKENKRGPKGNTSWQGKAAPRMSEKL